AARGVPDRTGGRVVAVGTRYRGRVADRMISNAPEVERFFDGHPRALAVYRAVEAALLQVAHPSKRIWMHHLEIDDAREVDERVVEWLRES
ncbi:MAG: hypothetical protein ACXVD2_07060, partial [Actinomycetota bacterium]